MILLIMKMDMVSAWNNKLLNANDQINSYNLFLETNYRYSHMASNKSSNSKESLLFGDCFST